MSGRFTRYAVLALVSSVVAVVVACGGDDDDTGPDASSPTVAQTSASAAVTATPQPTTPIDPATGLPITFPGEFLVYQPASVKRASDYGDRFVIQWESTDALDAVAAFYEDALSTEPWTTDELSNDGGPTRILFTGPGYSGEIGIARITDDVTTVLLNLQVEG